ncbi:MAG: glycoside hydrolase family 16 protein [Bacteroides sp.]|nr:glycoside hydrolase family 16 protein [Bacteroides sp.]
MKTRCFFLTLFFFLYGGLLSAQASYRLIWSDEFNADRLDETIWNIASGYGGGNDGWGNNELQNYTSDNISFRDGLLVITAKKTGDQQQRGEYTSARISTKNKQQFLYGRMEVRAKLPEGRGLWAAFWMLGCEGRWPDGGEIDIMEHVGYEPDVVHSALHTRSSFGATQNKGKTLFPDVNQDFHVFGITWTEDQIEFYVDDPQQPYYIYAPEEKNARTWPFDRPCYLLLNLAVGGHWGGKQGIDNTVFPAEYLIDWVRVYTADSSL